MEIRLQLKDQDADLLLRLLDEGATLQTDRQEHQERINTILQTIRRQLKHEIGRIYPPGPIE